jgi:hypothetical protein
VGVTSLRRFASKHEMPEFKELLEKDAEKSQRRWFRSIVEVIGKQYFRE